MKIVAPLEVGFCCSDLDRLVRFYVEVLGCELVSIIDVPAEKSQQAAVSRSGYRVARLQVPTGERLKFLEPKQPPLRQVPPEMILDRNNTSYLTFIVDDLKAMLERLEHAEVEVLTGASPIAVRPGVWLVFARDPELNLIEFVQYDDLEGYRQRRQ